MKDFRAGLGREWLVIAALTLVGAGLRFWAFGRLSLDHFDEGIYAFSGLWIAADDGLLGLDPGVIPYAPPGFPILVGLSYLAFGVADLSAIVVATLCGVATIPVVGWLGRRTFGPGAGAASATLGALSMAHIAFSRKALSDSPFLLAWLIAMGTGARYLEKPGLGRALALGLSVGLAQNVKYNGWLSGVLVGAAALLGTISRREERSPSCLTRTYGLGLVAAATAALLYAPWYYFVETHGGYAALLRHHRGYLGGVSSWWSHWNTQLGEAYALAGPRQLGALSWLIACLSSMLATSVPIRLAAFDRAKAVVFGFVLIVGAVVIAFQANLPWWVGLAGLPWVVMASQPSHRLLGAWWIVLSVLTPFYHPYARLWLPMQAVGWILLGGVIVRIGHFIPDSSQGSAPTREVLASPRRRKGAAAWAVACLLVSAIHLAGSRPSPMPLSWALIPHPSASLRAFVYDVLAGTASIEAKTLRVLARRPLAFYLVTRRLTSFQLEPDLGRLVRPSPPGFRAIVDEALLVQEGGEAEAMARLLPYWRPESSFQQVIDPVTLLDLHPEAAFQDQPRRVIDLWVMSPRIPPEALRSSGPGQPPRRGRDAP